MPDFIKLPSERVEQLRMLSEARKMPIADLIAEYVRDQIKDGLITNALPTFDVRRSGNTVSVNFGKFERKYDLEAAQAFAGTLDIYATPKSDLMEGAMALAGVTSVATQLFKMSRRGTSIKISGDNGEERTLAPSIARDLAALIKEAAI